MKLIQSRYLFICFYSSMLLGQQEITFTQFHQARQFFNPAAVGFTNQTLAQFFNRAQWINLEGAPNTQAYTIRGFVPKNNLGWGVDFFQDKIGPLEQVTASLDLSYHLLLNREAHILAVGLKFSAQNFNFNTDILAVQDPGDTFFDASNYGQFQPNIGFGLRYQRPHFYLSLSVPFMLDSEQFETVRHAYLSTGGQIKLSELWALHPNILLRQVQNAPASYDTNLLIYYQDRFWLGPSRRGRFLYSSTIESYAPASGIIGGLAINPSLSVGYSYSRLTGKFFSNGNTGTHELYLEYAFKTKEENQEKAIGTENKAATKVQRQ
ncbi:MAG: PorP/SprF family type IX secretion system membrane protein [Flavobacteriaceae bacterium]